MNLIKKYYLEFILLFVLIVLYLWVIVFYHQRMKEEKALKQQAETLRVEFFYLG